MPQPTDMQNTAIGSANTGTRMMQNDDLVEPLVDEHEAGRI